ncbi:MAG: ATP-binding protein [Deltaproteobacteria bacterium]|nr:ATP-binding protein [Deltaproteobacteria bacterium]
MRVIHEPWVFRKRWLSGEIRSAIEAFPVVVVTGARQVGKSTLLREE